MLHLDVKYPTVMFSVTKASVLNAYYLYIMNLHDNVDCIAYIYFSMGYLWPRSLHDSE